MDTATTVPDLGLESHLFIAKLAGVDDSFGDRDAVHREIIEWINKLREADDRWLHELDPSLLDHVKKLVPMMDSQVGLHREVETDRIATNVKISEVEKGFLAMQMKINATASSTGENLDHKLEALVGWKDGKIADLNRSIQSRETELKSMRRNLRSHLDRMIDDCKDAHTLDIGNGDDILMEDDPIMKEIDALLNSMGTTLQLGQKTPQLMQHDAQTHPGYDDRIMPGQITQSTQETRNESMEPKNTDPSVGMATGTGTTPVIQVQAWIKTHMVLSTCFPLFFSHCIHFPGPAKQS